MQRLNKVKRHLRRARKTRNRPFMIDIEDFDFADDCEMYDWMYGNPTEPGAS